MLVREAKLLNATPEQYQSLDEAIRTAQFVRNKCLRHWMDHRGVGKKELYALCKHLAAAFEFALNSHARQASAERAWAAISRFYANCKKKGVGKKGYPRFKKNCRSVEYKQSGWKLSPDGIAITFTDGNQAGTFALYCNGEARQLLLGSKINRVRVVRRADGYYAQFCLDGERREPGESTGKVVGLDLGLHHFYTDQDGNTVDCPKYLRRAEKRLKRQQRRLSRRLRKGVKEQSKRYLKQKRRVGKVHLKVQRQRRDWASKLARCVVASHDVVAYEDLPVKNLVKNHHLAKSIQDAAWFLFTQWLDYYGKVWGKVVVAVPPEYTTQECSGCGCRVKKTLSTRTHRCPKCGLVLCRDQNAALNILRRALKMLGVEWNGTQGQRPTARWREWGTASQEGTLGERGTAAGKGRPNPVSALVEPKTRILAL